jgi:four helix bundle protein
VESKHRPQDLAARDKDHVKYEEWEKTVPQVIQADSLWQVKAYRLAMFLADLGWPDATKLMSDRRTIGLADQLYRSLSSIGADIAEGYSRGTGKDRARFYEYALGTARESRDWYYKGRHILGETIIQHRLALLAEVIRLLLTMVPQQRGSALREEEVAYYTDPEAARQPGEG